jgi:hypothetical protein
METFVHSVNSGHIIGKGILGDWVESSDLVLQRAWLEIHPKFRKLDSGGVFMGGFFSFEKLISGNFIRGIYLVGMTIITIGAVFLILGIGKSYATYTPIDVRFQGIFLLFVGNLAWRITCEVWIVLFVIYERLIDISSNTKR